MLVVIVSVTNATCGVNVCPDVRMYTVNVTTANCKKDFRNVTSLAVQWYSNSEHV